MQNFEDRYEAYRWAIDNLLPRNNPTLLFNADHYHNAVQSQGAATIMSVDYPIQNKAFIMNLCPLWKCDALDCGKGGGRVPTPRETALYVEILESRQNLSLSGDSPIRTCIYKYYIQRGSCFCTFSTPNLSFWRSLSVYYGSKPFRVPKHDLGNDE